jgi:type I restriction enzyme, R subunit
MLTGEIRSQIDRNWDEEQIGNLLNHFQRIGDTTRPERGKTTSGFSTPCSSMFMLPMRVSLLLAGVVLGERMGEEREVDLTGFDSGHDVERFRDKTQQFLKAHEKEPVIHKLRWNEPLTREDLDRLQVIMAHSGAESLGGLKKVRSNG